ncbi:DUF493 family protein [Urechidicola sp. KH5]
MQSSEDFFEKLRTTLIETTTFPTKYLFKFIVPASKEKEEQIKDIFNLGGAVINTKESKTGKYKSVSILLNMPSADAIIKKYKEVGTIEGVIAL